MKTVDYQKLIILARTGENFTPVNESALNLLQDTEEGEIIHVSKSKNRDLKLHRAYMALLNYIYDYLPHKFHRAVKRQDFYKWLKHLAHEFDIIYEFADGSVMIEYISISFSKMDEQSFRTYVKNQLPRIYEDVLPVFYDGETLKNIIFNIEQEFEKFLTKLYSSKSLI